LKRKKSVQCDDDDKKKKRRKMLKNIKRNGKLKTEQRGKKSFQLRSVVEKNKQQG
jgi:hypothetical protein